MIDLCPALLWRRVLVLAALAWSLLFGSGLADDPPAAPAPLAGDTPSLDTTSRPDDSPASARKQMIARIDHWIESPWRESSTTPAPQCRDEEFLRRASLDLCGVIPRVSTVRQFLADRTPDRRERLIEELLASPAYATHQATTWRNIILPGGIEPEQAPNAAGVQNWLRVQFAENARYDRMVSDLLVATRGNEAGPALFYTSLDLQPEKLAAASARIFLGLQIECAQCHHHPFDHWKQDDFWSYAAFFSQVRLASGSRAMRRVRLEDVGVGEVQLPNTQTVVAPRFPGGESPRESRGTRREQLAIWMASRDNPYLAPALVNRVWAQLFGRGLVEPVDDLGPRNPASHPELLAELSNYFVDNGFDIKELLRTLTATRAYQRSSEWPFDQEPAADQWLRMPLKPLTPEQLFDSLGRLLGRETAEGTLPGSTFTPRKLAFLTKMQSPSRTPAEYHGGVLQALTLLNGDETQAASSPEKSGLIQSIDSPLFSVQEQIEVLFLATVSRFPSDEEIRDCQEHLESAGLERRRQALSDILWAIVNGAEFAMNH